MSDFIQRSNRSIALPLGCKDLMDVEAIRDWKAASHPDVFKPLTKDHLAFVEDFLAERLETAGHSTLVGIWRFLDRGQIFVHKDPELVVPVVVAIWNGPAQEQAIRGTFEDAGISAATEPIGRWKEGKRLLKYLLPTATSKAAQLIGEVLRVGYGLNNLSMVSLYYHERNAA